MKIFIESEIPGKTVGNRPENQKLNFTPWSVLSPTTF